MNRNVDVATSGGSDVDIHRSYKGTGLGFRVLLYSHDTFGLGHLQRSLKISRAIKRKYPDLSILLVTGSPQVHRYLLPDGIDYVKLPAVRKTADEQYEPRTPGTSFKRIFGLRSRLLLEAVRQYSPHVLLVDHSPLGMKGEMIPALEWHSRHKRNSFAIIGLRDIVDEPTRVIELWEKQHVYDAFREFYDNIIIYGSPVVFDPITAYKFPNDIRKKTKFCGYITDINGKFKTQESMRSIEKKKPFVVITIGGGDGAGEVVVGTFLRILEDNRKNIPFESLIITGPFVSNDLWSDFRRQARGLPTILKKFVPRTKPYLKRSDLIVSTGGYNTTAEVLGYGRRGLIIPRIMFRQEQLIRAQKLCGLGLVNLLHPDDASPERFYDTIITMLSSADEPLSRGRLQNIISMDGADRLTSFCGKLFAKINS